MFRTPTKAQRAAASIAALLITATVMSAAGSRAGNAPLTATALPKNGALAIVKFRYRTDGGGNGTGIFVVAPDGSGAHWFTSGRGLDPSWSPDGKTLFFTRRQETELWIADQHGRHQTKIESVSSSGPGLFYPGDWSPDGSQSVGWRDPGLYTARFVGARFKQFRLVVRDASAGASAWSPVASEIAYLSAGPQDKPEKLLLVNADGSNVHVLASSFGVSAPSWSADGSTIAFTRCVYREAASLSLIDRDGSNLRDVLQLPRGSCVDPSWSPDGSTIAFAQCDAHEGGWLSLIDRDGSNLRNLVQLPNGPCPSDITWSPDGTQIVFVSGGSRLGHHALEVVAADGTSQKTLLSDVLCCVSWQPLGS